MSDETGKQSFWSTIPGILTAISGVLGAVAALIVALVSVGVIGPQDKQTPPSSTISPGPPNGGIVTSAPKPRPEEFRVVEAILRADPFNYSGPCPVTIKFTGRISTAGGSGVVSYKF